MSLAALSALSAFDAASEILVQSAVRNTKIINQRLSLLIPSLQLPRFDIDTDVNPCYARCNVLV
jgi:hypothetical protein